MKVQKILHLRVGLLGWKPADNGGCTVILDGDTSTTYITMRVAYCNPKDVFCKKAGRLQAESAPFEVIPLRSLPAVLGGLWKEAHKRAKHPALTPRPSYDNMIRYFLPKE